jgi:hypothetical protein
MHRPRRDSRQHNGVTLHGLSQPTSATKSARNGLPASQIRQIRNLRYMARDLCESRNASTRAMLDNETITLRATKIGGHTYPDDYTVTWRGLRIGRIRKNPGLPAHLDQWSWGCNVYGEPPRRDDSGQGADLEDCKAKFKIAWARKCAGLTDRAITKARELQLADELESAPALGRFG